jgi:ATP-dependent exoDNAse (exonuclease V) beta subunit
MAFSKCPRRFYLDRFFSVDSLGFMPDKASTGPISDERNNELGASAILVGTLVHQILESYERDMNAWESGAAPPERIIEALDDNAGVMAEQAHCMKKPLISEAVIHLQNIVMSGVLKYLGSETDNGEKRVLREIPFELRNDELIVVGTIDRLAQAPDDSWTLWDYKTTRLNGRSKEEVVKEEAYDVQLWTYAWAANQILGVPVSKAAIVFTSDRIDPVCDVPVDSHLVKQSVGVMLSSLAEIIDRGMESYKTQKSTVMCSSCSCSKLELC